MGEWKKKTLPNPSGGMERLLGDLRGLIQSARQQAVRAVDLVQVRTCWEVGRHIVEFDNAAAREWYMAEAATQNWGTRALERQIGTL